MHFEKNNQKIQVVKLYDIVGGGNTTCEFHFLGNVIATSLGVLLFRLWHLWCSHFKHFLGFSSAFLAQLWQHHIQTASAPTAAQSSSAGSHPQRCSCHRAGETWMLSRTRGAGRVFFSMAFPHVPAGKARPLHCGAGPGDGNVGLAFGASQRGQLCAASDGHLWLILSKGWDWALAAPG